jgi:hypothetical protein
MGADEIENLLAWHRSAEEIALPLRTAGSEQHFQVGFRLDAFGHRRHPERSAQPNDGTNDRRILLAAVSIIDEGAIDLDPI